MARVSTFAAWPARRKHDTARPVYTKPQIIFRPVARNIT